MQGNPYAGRTKDGVRGLHQTGRPEGPAADCRAAMPAETRQRLVARSAPGTGNRGPVAFPADKEGEFFFRCCQASWIRTPHRGTFARTATRGRQYCTGPATSRIRFPGTSLIFFPSTSSQQAGKSAPDYIPHRRFLNHPSSSAVQRMRSIAETVLPERAFGRASVGRSPVAPGPLHEPWLMWRPPSDPLLRGLPANPRSARAFASCGRDGHPRQAGGAAKTFPELCP